MISLEPTLSKIPKTVERLRKATVTLQTKFSFHFKKKELSRVNQKM